MDVSGEVKSTIAKELKRPVEELQDDAKLSDLGVESLDVIEIIFALEEKFDIDISVKASAGPQAAAGGLSLTDLATVGDVCRTVQSLVDSKQ